MHKDNVSCHFYGCLVLCASWELASGPATDCLLGVPAFVQQDGLWKPRCPKRDTMSYENGWMEVQEEKYQIDPAYRMCIPPAVTEKVTCVELSPWLVDMPPCQCSNIGRQNRAVWTSDHICTIKLTFETDHLCHANHVRCEHSFKLVNVVKEWKNRSPWIR